MTLGEALTLLTRYLVATRREYVGTTWEDWPDMDKDAVQERILAAAPFPDTAEFNEAFALVMYPLVP